MSLLWKRLPTVVMLVALWLEAATPALADTLTLKSGRRVEGIVVGETPDSVEIKVDGAKVRIARSQVASIERESTAHGALRRADFALARDDALDAERLAGEALGARLGRDELRAWCVARRERIARAIRAGSPAALEAWAERARTLAGLTEAPEEFGQAAELTSPSLLSVKELLLVAPATTASAPASLDLVALPSTTTLGEADFAFAMAETFAELGRNTLAARMLEMQSNERLRAEVDRRPFAQIVLKDYVRRSLRAGDFGAAVATTARMEAAAMGETAKACRALALLRWTSLARERLLYRDALEVLDAALAPIFPALAEERMLATLADARQRLAERERYAEAIELYRTWGERLPDSNPRESAAALAREWGDALLDRGEPTRARQAFELLLSLDPAADASLLKICDLEERLTRAVAAEDWRGAFELGQEASAQGLLGQAAKSFERAARSEALKPLALEQVEMLERRIAQAHFDHCMAWYEQGRPDVAVEELEKFPFYSSTQFLQPEIKELRQYCHDELSRRASLHTVTAEAMFQNAERRFYLGERDTAMRDLREVVERYAGTPAAERAERFLIFARARTLLEELEGRGATEGTSALPERSNSEIEREIRYLIEQLRRPMGDATATR